MISILGAVVRILTVGYVPGGTSGRNTARQKAAELNTTGIYSLVRHPLYLGNYLIFLGFVLLLQSWSIALAATCLYYERIIAAEEAFLHAKFGAEFEAWAGRTPIMIPRLSGWVSPRLPFSMRSVLVREYTTPLLILVVFAGFDIVADSWIEHHLVLDWAGISALLGAVLVWFTMRLLKKRSRLLHVAGR